MTTYEVDFKEHKKAHIVKVDISTKFCKCSCARFETWGILCKHILYIMKQKLRVKVIPEEYILQRWTLNARYKTISCQNYGESEANETNTSKGVTALEAWILRGDLNKVYEKVICHRELYEQLKNTIHESLKRVHEIEKIQMLPLLTNNVESSTAEGSQATQLNFTIRDPAKCKTKGRPKIASRIPTGMQEAQDLKQKKNCNLCGQTGHYRSTCKKVD